MTMSAFGCLLHTFILFLFFLLSFRRYIKHSRQLRVCQKYSATYHIFNSLLQVFGNVVRRGFLCLIHSHGEGTCMKTSGMPVVSLRDINQGILDVCRVNSEK